MREILFEFDINPTTWVYISSLMMIGIYFKFRRFWSVRNLDLAALILYAPGLLMALGLLSAVRGDPALRLQLHQFGYVWLFGVGGFVLFRLLLDPMMVRRPLLEPNLSASGLTFTCISLLVFLMSNVITQSMRESEVTGGPQAEYLITHGELPPEVDMSRYGPGYPLFQIFAGYSENPATQESTPAEVYSRGMIRRATTRSTAIVGHLAVVLGLVLIGYRHFDAIHTGVAMASLYLLVPYTAQMTPRVDHVIPAALLVWAVEAYRRPVVAGVFVGLAAAVIFYPVFLLPLWCGFYWRRGLFRFLAGSLGVLLLMVLSLVLISASWESFSAQLQHMFGLASLSEKSVAGFWQYHVSFYRIPVFVAFVVLCGSLALWPPQKNYGILLSCSAAVMLGTQFWHAPYGGTYLGWYLPLLLLTMFRPNLEDRVAVSAVTEAWKRPRKADSGTSP
jgi:hypothetical protein